MKPFHFVSVTLLALFPLTHFILSFCSSRGYLISPPLLQSTVTYRCSQRISDCGLEPEPASKPSGNFWHFLCFFIDIIFSQANWSTILSLWPRQ